MTSPYAVSVYDELVGLILIEDAEVDSTALNALLTKFCGMNQFEFGIFMKKLIKEGLNEHIADLSTDDHYSVVVRSIKNLPKKITLEVCGTFENPNTDGLPLWLTKAVRQGAVCLVEMDDYDSAMSYFKVKTSEGWVLARSNDAIEVKNQLVYVNKP